MPFSILNRGKAQKQKAAAFRIAYGKLRDIRSYVPLAPFLALTATASSKTRHRFQRILGMKSPHVILRTPDRSNIMIKVQHVTDSSCINDVIKELQQLQLKCPRVVIYCKTVTDCTTIFALIDEALGTDGYLNGKTDSSSRLFCMYFHVEAMDRQELSYASLLANNMTAQLGNTLTICHTFEAISNT